MQGKDLKNYADNYINLVGFEKYLIHYRRKKLLSMLGYTRNKSFLEIGCGTDSLLNYITDFSSFTTVEPVNDFAMKAKSDSNDMKNVSILTGFLENQCAELQGFSFDNIVASSVLHEVGDTNEFLKSIHSLCSDVSIVHLIVPNAKSLHKLLAVSMGIISSVYEHSELAKTFQRVTAFDLESLTTLVCDVGFEVVDSSTYFLKPLANDQMLALLDNDIVIDSFMDALYDVSKEHCQGLGAEIYMRIRRR